MSLTTVLLVIVSDILTSIRKGVFYMKIAVPVDEKSLDSAVCISFGRTPLFLIYDTETKTETYLDNSAISEQGGAGIKASQNLVDADANALITLHCGENAAEVLNAGEIKIYKAALPTAKENIEALAKGELKILTEIHPGYHKH